MPLYHWLCQDEECKHVTEVSRSISQYDVPPEEGCEKCKKKELQKIILPVEKHQISLVWGGKVPWHDEAYGPRKPIR